MQKIEIEDIEREPGKILEYEFNEFMPEFGADIHADLEFKSLGEFVEVTGEVTGKLKLTCDRCLNEFEYDLDIDIDETFAKRALLYDLLYQSVILALPNKKVCGINCNEGMFASDENNQVHDNRMDIFKTIKIERKE